MYQTERQGCYTQSSVAKVPWGCPMERRELEVGINKKGRKIGN